MILNHQIGAQINSENVNKKIFIPSEENSPSLFTPKKESPFLNKDPLYREKHWHDYRMADRWWNHAPIYSYGPFDINCWLLSSMKAEQPLYKYLGAYRDTVPIYVSSLVLSTPEAYAKEAVEYKKRGFNAYKLHPPGNFEFDLATFPPENHY